MSEFLYMGGYGYYVWSAYGLSFVVLVLNVVAARRQHKQVREELQRMLQKSQ